MGTSDKTKFNFATWKMLHMKRNIFWLFTMCSSYVLAAAAQHFVCCRLTFGHHGLQRAQPNQRCEQTQTLWTCFRVAIIWDQDVWVRSQHLQTSASAGGGCTDHWPRKRGKREVLKCANVSNGDRHLFFTLSFSGATAVENRSGASACTDTGPHKCAAWCFCR